MSCHFLQSTRHIGYWENFIAYKNSSHSNSLFVVEYLACHSSMAGTLPVYECMWSNSKPNGSGWILHDIVIIKSIIAILEHMFECIFNVCKSKRNEASLELKLVRHQQIRVRPMCVNKILSVKTYLFSWGSARCSFFPRSPVDSRLLRQSMWWE